MRIDHKFVAIVTGGASGLGEATVKLLAAMGANVVIADLNVESGIALAKSLPSASFFKTDVANQENVKELFAFTKKTYTNVHAVINCAGILSAGLLIYSKGVASSSEMERVLRINVIGTFNMSKYAAKMMSEQEEVEGERGVIINVASVAGFEGQKGQTVYSASKGAIIGMTLPMARDLGKFKIRVMALAPGVFSTPMGDGIQDKALEIIRRSTPLGRVGVSHEFATAVKGIIESSFATGDVWRLDGGIRLPYL